MNTEHPINGDEFTSLIKERIKNFWGYGNLDGDIWFVGMEEGYNADNEVLFERFKATAHKQIADIYDDLKVDPGHVVWFEKDAPSQPTYKPLIFILHYLETKMAPTLHQLKDIQINSFGRSGGNHAVLELMPLPSKSVNDKDWLYGEAQVEGLESRKTYMERYKPERVEALKALIEKHKPKLVLFYTKTYMEDWKNIAGTEYTEQIPKLLQTARNHDTLFAVVPHPVSFGISTSDWEAIAEKLDELIT